MSGPNGTTTFTVRFAPTAAGSRSASIHIASNDRDESVFDINLTGLGLPPLVITWNNPKAITYGTALSAKQLDARANVPGKFVYSPAAGAILPVGLHALSVVFTPTDTAHYSTTQKSVTLTVNKAVATVTLTGLSQMYNGQPRPVTVTTVPSGLTVKTTYNGSPIAPTRVGSYGVVATVTDPNATGTKTGTLVIAKGIKPSPSRLCRRSMSVPRIWP